MWWFACAAAVCCAFAALGTASAAVYSDYTAASYVQDGLVLQFDGIDNQGTGSHVADATTWKCLKTGNEIALAEGAGFRDGRYLFVTNVMSSTGTFFGANPNPEATLEVMTRPAGDWPSYNADWTAAIVGNGLAVSFDTRRGSGLSVQGVTNLAACTYRWYSGVDHPNNTGYVAGLKARRPDTYAVQTSPEAEKNLFGVNGAAPASYGQFYAKAYAYTDGIRLNKDPVGDTKEVRTLEDYAIRAYSRKLTAAELAQNANVDKLRFVYGAGTTVTWTGNGGTLKWNNAANWCDPDGNACLPGAGDTLVIANATGATLTLENDLTDLSVAGFSITATSPVALTGNAITLTGAAKAWSSTGTITVANPIVLGAGDQTFSFIGSVTLNGTVSGAGALVKTYATAGTVVSGKSVVEVFGNLVLTQENSYTGGTKILKGSIQGDHVRAFGPTTKAIYVDGNIATSPVSVHTALRVNVTEFDYPVEVNSSYTGGPVWHQSSMLGHNIDMLKANTHFRGTLSGGSIGIHAYTEDKHNGGNAVSGDGYVDGDVNCVGTFSLQGGNSKNFYVNGKVTGVNLHIEPYYSSILRLYNSGNRFTGSYSAVSGTLVAEGEDVLHGLSTTFGYFYSTGPILLHGHDQHMNRIGSFSNWNDPRPPLSSGNHTVWADMNNSGTRAAKLWLDSTADNVSYERYGGALTLIYNPTDNYRLTCESNRVNEMSGELIVSNGTFFVKDKTTFLNVSRIEVAPGATLEAYGTKENFFKGAKELFVASGGAFKVASGSEPFADGSAVTVRIEKDATLELPAGYTLPAVALYVDGVKKATDTYTKETVPQITGDGAIEVTTPTVWKARGADDNVDTAANWGGDENPPFDGTAAPTVTNGTCMTVNRDVSFKGMTLNVPGTAGFTVTTNGTDAATLTLLKFGLTPAAAASGTQAYTFAAPVALLASSDWIFPDSGTSVTFTQRPGGGLASKDVTIRKTGLSPLVLKGAGAGDYSGDWDLEGYVKVSGDDPFGRDVEGATGTVYLTAIGGTSSPDLLHFTGDTTIRKNVVVKSSTNNNQDFVLDDQAKVTFLGSVTFAEYMRKRTSQGGALTFAGGVSGKASVDEIHCALVVTNKPAKFGTTGMTSQSSADQWYSFMAPSNEMNYIQFWYDHSVRFGANDAFYDGRTILQLCSNDAKYLNQRIDLGHYTNRISNISGSLLSGRMYSTGGAAHLTLSQKNTTGYSGTSAPITDGMFRGVVEGDVSLLMDGPYTFTLKNANTSVGSLAVTNGTLALATDASLAAGKTASWAGRDILVGGTGTLSSDNASAFSKEAVVRISDAGVLALGFTGTNTVDKLFIDGVPVAAGVYGSADSAAPAENRSLYGSHFSGTGLLKVRHPKGLVIVVW